MNAAELIVHASQVLTEAVESTADIMADEPTREAILTALHDLDAARAVI